ncbi:NADH-quinone oxidoreductase subunit K [Thioalkalivibrio sp. XN279]|uniref:NADH-quinone oxidoreductase subunit K n=1 Tax=Thioalkalivibrio sp. XN279 TaxID=2714953 RepID=UPI00140B47C0|nr:Na+/H+ antiporter subunit C [Thioalkalivibrio sp. XN279]
MSGPLLYACAGLGLLIIGSWALVLRAHLIRKVLAINVMGSGAFLLLVGAGAMGTGPVDPVPQAMVITGIVVAISATALALALVLRIAYVTGKPALPEDRERDLMDEEGE